MNNPEPAPRVDPAEVTDARFTLTPLGRRGYQPEEVDEFLARVAAELTRRDEAAESLRGEADRYRDALREWQSRHSQRQPATAEALDADAVAQLAQAQQQAEEQLAQTREYCRQLIEQARTQARQLLDQARQQAEQATAEARDEADEPSAQQERRLARERSSLDAISAAEQRLREAREHLASEVEGLTQEARD